MYKITETFSFNKKFIGFINLHYVILNPLTQWREITEFLFSDFNDFAISSRQDSVEINQSICTYSIPLTLVHTPTIVEGKGAVELFFHLNV